MGHAPVKWRGGPRRASSLCGTNAYHFGPPRVIVVVWVSLVSGEIRQLQNWCGERERKNDRAGTHLLPRSLFTLPHSRLCTCFIFPFRAGVGAMRDIGKIWVATYLHRM